MDLDSTIDRHLLRALVAEDDPGVRRLLVDLLEADGWDVREAGDGAEAVEVAERWRPDLVVTDVMMPRMDGLEATAALRGQADHDGCAIVVVSAKPEAEERARAAGSDDFVAKPFEAGDLATRTRAALARRQARVH